MSMGIAIVGCGYAADFYLANLRNYPELYLVGVYDRNIERLRAFCDHHQVRPFNALEDLWSDQSIELVLNLTNPSQHYNVSLAALAAKRHVYSEKPFALSLDEGRRLILTAKENEVQLASAPCSLLGEAAQTAWAALRKGEIGQPLLVLAELNEGMIHQMLHRCWVSASGAVWPSQDEFQTGCTLEHAAYILLWLTAFFGRIDELTATSSLMAPEKNVAGQLAPDFSCAIVRFASGVVARITFSIVAPPDHSMTIVGQEGVLEIADIWDFDSPIYIQQRSLPNPDNPSQYLEPRRVYPLLQGPERPFRYYDSHNMDQMRGVAEMAQAIRAGHQSRLSADRALHVLEATLAIKDAGGPTAYHKMETPFEEVEPVVPG